MKDSHTALTENEVAKWLGLSVATLRAWRFRQTGPRFVRFGRAVRYLPSDIELFISKNTVDTTPPSVSDDSVSREGAS